MSDPMEVAVAAIDQLILVRPSGDRLQIGAAALTAMRHHCQGGGATPESGGVLLGRHLLGCRDIVVDAVTIPLAGDRQGRHRFFRARRRHQAAIDRAWRESGGTCTYLGEWHTHPEPVPSPSECDRRDWQRRLRVDRFSEPIFFIIIGTVEIGVWEGRRAGKLCFLGYSRIVQP